jgi:hypothetical protein
LKGQGLNIACPFEFLPDLFGPASSHDLREIYTPISSRDSRSGIHAFTDGFATKLFKKEFGENLIQQLSTQKGEKSLFFQ